MGETEKKQEMSGLKVFLLATICTVMWGSAFSCIKLGYRFFGITDGTPFDKILFAGCRFFLAGIILIIIMSVIRKKRMIFNNTKDWIKVFVVGLVFTCFQYVFFYLGVGNTTGARSSIITGAGTFFMVILGAIFLKGDPITPRKAIGCVIGFVGVILINWTAGSEVAFTIAGDGFVLIAAFLFAVGNTMVKVFGKELDSTAISGWQLLFGGVLLIIIGLMGGGHLNEINTNGILIFMYLISISVVAYALWAYLMDHNPVSKVSVYFFINPASGVLLSGLILNEDVFNLKNLISLIIVCLGIVIVNTSGRKSEK